MQGSVQVQYYTDAVQQKKMQFLGRHIETLETK